jgi:hypothetical protein
VKLGLTKAFKRLEPDDGKLSSPVLRGRRRWQHLFCYPTTSNLESRPSLVDTLP